MNKTMYQVSYRISEKPATTKAGEYKTSDERYDDLTADIRSRAAEVWSHFADPGHVGTSTWLVQTVYNTQDLFDELSRNIAEGYDMFEVVPIEFGKAITAPEAVNA